MASAKNKLSDLQAVHDKKVVVPNRIKGALAKLKATGQDWAYESDFMRLASPPVSVTDISRFREGFKDFWRDMPSTNGTKSSKRVWFVSPTLAKQWDDALNA